MKGLIISIIVIAVLTAIGCSTEESKPKSIEESGEDLAAMAKTLISLLEKGKFEEAAEFWYENAWIERKLKWYPPKAEFRQGPFSEQAEGEAQQFLRQQVVSEFVREWKHEMTDVTGLRYSIDALDHENMTTVVQIHASIPGRRPKEWGERVVFRRGQWWFY